jgi:hypothetical protein
MSYRLKQRFPNFFSGFIPEEHNFNSIEDLYNINFIKRWISNKKFKKLSMTLRKCNQHILMCEMNDGTYWAIGWLYGVEDMKSGLSEFKK